MGETDFGEGFPITETTRPQVETPAPAVATCPSPDAEWRRKVWTGAIVLAVVFLGCVAYYAAGPSEKDIQTSHAQYEQHQLAAEIATLSARSDRFEQAEKEKQAALALERKYAKYWHERGLKVR